MSGYMAGLAAAQQQVGPLKGNVFSSPPCVEGRIQTATSRVAEAASRARGAAQMVEAFTGRLLGPPPPVPVGDATVGPALGALDELGAAIGELHRGLDWLASELERLQTIG